MDNSIISSIPPFPIVPALSQTINLYEENAKLKDELERVKNELDYANQKIIRFINNSEYEKKVIQNLYTELNEIKNYVSYIEKTNYHFDNHLEDIVIDKYDSLNNIEELPIDIDGNYDAIEQNL
jgi:seryl-tRNA synthetase